MSTFVQYDGADGDLGKFSVPFPYLLQQHVKVKVNGFPQTQGVHYQFDDPASIRFMPWAVPLAGTVVEIRRNTSSETPLVNYQNGSVLTAEDLNVGNKQNFFLIQEIVDKYEAMLGAGASRLSNGQFTNAQNLIDAAVASVLDSSLLAELQSRISDIDQNAESIMDQAARLAEVQSVVDTLLEIDGVGIATYIQNAVDSLTTADEALAGRVALLGAEANGGTAFQLDLDTVYVGPGESFAGRLSTITSSINGNTASIQSQQTVINGLAAQWMVKTDVNGHVAGFGLYNNGATSQFIVSAGTFAVSNGASVKTPFVITGGVCYLQNVVIKDALIENLTVGKLTSGVLNATIVQNADINVGTGRIIWSNGAYMKVAGVGFGTSGQFLEWFGPTMSVSSCSESNAIYYLRTNGSAYFGGSLSAGTLKTSGQTSDINATATVTIGPFGTNGNPINVVLSYNMSRYGSENGTGNQNQSFPILSYLNLYRSIGGGAEVLVAQLNLSGACVHGSHIAGEGHSYSQALNGSTTYTDTAGGTGLRTYRAIIASRSLHHTPGGQTISIIATEQ